MSTEAATGSLPQRTRPNTRASLKALNFSSMGKALADAKLLKEYDVKDGDTVNLMVKPGFQWDPTATSKPEEKNLEATPATITLIPEPKESKSRHGHSRIPSVVLSPSPSLTPLADEKLVDIPLVLDTSNLPTNSGSPAPDTPYHTIISKPEFWERLYTFLGSVLFKICGFI